MNTRLSRSQLRFLRWLAHVCSRGTTLGRVSPLVEQLARRGYVVLDGLHAAMTPDGQRVLATASASDERVYFVDYERAGVARRAGPYVGFEAHEVFEEFAQDDALSRVRVVECVPGESERVLAGTCEPPITISTSVEFVKR